MNPIRIVLFSLAITCSSLGSRAQTAMADSTLNNYLFWIEEAYSTANHLKFHVNYTAAYIVDTNGLQTDTFTMEYHLNRDSFVVKTPEVDQIQDSLHLVTVFKSDSVIRIQHPVDLVGELFNVALGDSSFRKYITSMYEQDSAGMKILSFNFSEHSPVSAYSLSFDSSTHFLQSIHLVMGDSSEYIQTAFPPDPQAYYDITLHFCEYQTGVNDYSEYNIYQYVIFQDGQWALVSPYTEFGIITE